MNRQRLRRLQAGWDSLFAADENDRFESDKGAASMAHLFDHSPELMDAAEQVASEQRGRVLIIAQHDEQCRWLLAHLRRQPPTPSFRHVAREGLFTLVCLPDVACAQANGAADAEPAQDEEELYGWRDRTDPFDLMAEELLDADLALLLIAPAPGADAAAPASDLRTFARLRASGVPVLPVLLYPAQQAENGVENEAKNAPQVEPLRRLLGVQPLLLPWSSEEWAKMASGAAVSAPQQELLGLVERILAIRPRLSIVLAQELPFCRSLIAARVIRTGAWITAMVGIEPIPIIDLPLQVALQWKVILQVAAIYGRPGLDVRSKEMASTVGLSVVMRLVTQQLVKLVPVIGWALSGLLSGVSTLLLGHAFLRYYERDQVVNLRAAGAVLQRGARRTLLPLRTVRQQLGRQRLRLLRRRQGGRHA